MGNVTLSKTGLEKIEDARQHLRNVLGLEDASYSDAVLFLYKHWKNNE